MLPDADATANIRAVCRTVGSPDRLPDFIADFAADSEFLKLLGRRTDVDLVRAALELARDAEPALDFRRPRAGI
jgi:hypothetical protein